MKKLLSLPPNLAGCFHKITGLDEAEYFCTNDPVGRKLGSGGGTVWLLEQCHEHSGEGKEFAAWLASERRILIHAGGQSRRLPAYAATGKALTPVPVFRWERGQRLSQTLLDLQLPLYERLMDSAPENIHTLVASGDVYVRGNARQVKIPNADVVCFGLWLDSSVAVNHGVFVADRKTPSVLRHMIQKPSMGLLNDLLQTSFCLVDIGVWMLSDRAVELLRKRSRSGGELSCYDLYSEFGCSLGADPTLDDPELRSLSVAVLPLPQGEFYHFGTSSELISSALTIQNLVNDQREILHHSRKPHPSIFVQNAEVSTVYTSANFNIWIENSHVGGGWVFTNNNIVTGVPRNNWHVSLRPRQCVDIVPVGEGAYAVRTYLIDDKFEGEEQRRKRFPVVDGGSGELGMVVVSMLNGDAPDGKYELLSAEDIACRANLERLFAQKREFRRECWKALADNGGRSIFYQTDLCDAASEYSRSHIPLPKPLPETAPLLTRMSDAMFRSEAERLAGKPSGHEDEAFSLLKTAIVQSAIDKKQSPRMSVYADQIVWGRSPVRIDIAGGWTDTPPYCLIEGGSVINLAVELNGQSPLQAYIRPCRDCHIVLRSIDLGASETVETYSQLADFMRVGSPFSIPKAALALAGFLPDFCAESYDSLAGQLKAFGCGIEVTLLSAIPAGSGMGTSSVLSATVLGALSDFCALAWDKNEICNRTLVLEQLLTTGGGWQDQYGGVFGGVKLLQTAGGMEQSPTVRWLPADVFTRAEYRDCHLLYYTGITRTAKGILHEIVRRMFLNHNAQLALLRDMKAHVMDMYDAIQRCDMARMGRLVRESWRQNQAIDSGTNPEAVRRITSLIDDLCLGYKLPGAGGGGYLYMVAKDPEAAARIRRVLTENRANACARFVDMALDASGLQISRS